MTDYKKIKTEILSLIQQLNDVFTQARTIPGMTDYRFGNWETILDNIESLLAEDIIRVAVVGSIKSGKSTFVNSLFKNDYLKRGAGVITSIVTRIVPGETLKAELFFKSWEEINAELRQAIILFPSENLPQDDFDIRNTDHRTRLETALADLPPDIIIADGVRNTNSVLISHYLEGYDEIKDWITQDSATVRFENESFYEHLKFTGNDVMAAFLKDIRLEIETDRFSNETEIADCQGSDSVNPLHLSMIQEYLLTTHMIVYVISSRIGVREADVKFLSMIKKMGIIDNIVFVVNIDFNEHESLDDLSQLIGRIKNEIAMIKPDPELFSFSALYNLFKSSEIQLNEKDASKVSQWELDRQIASYSNQESRQFDVYLKTILTRKRYFLLLKNHIERLKYVHAGITQWISIHQNMLEKDTESVDETVSQIKNRQEKIEKVKSLLKRSINGAKQEIKSRIRTNTDRFFDTYKTGVTGKVLEFIKNYNFSPDVAESHPNSTFTENLYSIFQDFKQSLDTYLAENINPELIQFIKNEENEIITQLNMLTGSFQDIIEEAIQDIQHSSEEAGQIFLNRDRIDFPDIESIKKKEKLSYPMASNAMQYTTAIKTEAVVKFGLYRVILSIKNFFRKTASRNREDKKMALRDGMTRIKKETEKSVRFLFVNYRENIKFQYLFKFVDALSDAFYERLIDYFSAYTTDLVKIGKLIQDQKVDKEQVVKIIKDTERIALSAKKDLDGIASHIEQS